LSRTAKSGDATVVACDGNRIIFFLPGQDWKVEPSPVPEELILASAGSLNASVRAAPTEETQYDLEEHLKAIYAGASEALTQHKLRVGPPRLIHAPNGHLVLVHDITPQDEPLRMLNAWTALRHVSRRYIDFHISVTLSASDPLWSDPEQSPEQSLLMIADAFTVNDGHGETPPQ
jgi:hypothetical protein